MTALAIVTTRRAMTRVERVSRAEARLGAVLAHLNVSIQDFGMTAEGVITAVLERELTKEETTSLGYCYKLLNGTKGAKLICVE
jgi:hypothetical protein